MLKRVRRGVARRVQIARDWAKVQLATRHMSGRRKISLRDDDVGVVCLIKNGEYYIPELLHHHRSIGAKHFLFIDNGSTDKTIKLLSNCEDVTLVRNELPVKWYETKLRAQLAKMVFKGGWLLFVDSDELIQIPFGENKRIGEFLRYCNNNEYNVVVGQCLDLFSLKSINETADLSYEECTKIFDKYSLEYIDEFDYHDKENVSVEWFLRKNIVSNEDIKIKYGGIRRELFGEYCGLTNHRLVRNLPQIGIYTHSHCCSNARCADFTLLIRHYKFAGQYLDRERAQLMAGTWRHGEDVRRFSKTSESEFRFLPQNSRQYVDTAKLVDEGFLVCSDKFLNNFR